MASPFYNRLVGVTILVACVVIFLPSIIDGKKTVYHDEIVAMPIKPLLKAHRPKRSQAEKKQTIVTLSSNPTSISENKMAIENNQWQVKEVAPAVVVDSVKSPSVAEKQDPSKLQKTAAKSAWTIQLGAFQNAKNINLLLKKLSKAGFQAHTVPSEVIDGELTRVFVGPDVSKNKLEKQLPQLKRLTKLQGKLLPFNAVNP